MIILTVNEVVKLHKKLINKTGGLQGIREMGLLESAIYGCMQTFNDEELYPTVVEKSARVAYSLCANHAFIDGNKRIAMLVMLMTLKMNGVNIKYSQQELIRLGLETASGKVMYENIVEWINSHMCI